MNTRADPLPEPLSTPMSFVAKLIRHLRRGTLAERIAAGFGRLPRHVRVRWQGAQTPHEAALALARWGAVFVGEERRDGWVLSVGDGNALHEALNAELRRRRVPFRTATLEEACGFGADEAAGLKGVLCGHAETAKITAAARRLASHPALGSVPFEYAASINRERRVFAELDEYADTYFVAPGLLDTPGPYAIYEESLTRFEQKCGLRDYLDLYQVLRYIVDNRVDGDIAEFGSYRGHSGWLIARTLQALGSDKKLYMFDTFEEFPAESFGVDHHWNSSHYVDFGEVRDKLSGFANVTLVKGDFTQTLAQSPVRRLALAYIDCDSYRATRFLIDALWSTHLSPRAALVCEDYGHPALLGNRVAVHEELDARPDAFKFFSQFSGLHITLKLSS
jgi:O-methyltransferase